MKKTYKLDFQKIRRKTQIKDIISFDLYLKNIFKDLSKRDNLEKDTKGIEKISFIDYINLPFIVGEKLFNIIDKNKNGFLSQTEFVTGIINLYVGGLEETQKMIFNLIDFDDDGKIIPEDSRLLISFIKNLANPPSNVMKKKPRTTLSDEENLEEINLIINDFFANKRILTFEEFKYNIENVNSDVFFLFICFLYNNKPFNDSSIKILKLLSKNSNSMISSDCSSIFNTSNDNVSGDEFKNKIKSPSKNFKSFIFDIVDLDIEEIQRDCEENSGEYESIDEGNNLISENLIKISVPHLKSKVGLYKLKGNKDYLNYDTPNRKNVGTIIIKKSFENYVKRMKDLILEDYDLNETHINSHLDPNKNTNKRFKEGNFYINEDDISEKNDIIVDLKIKRKSMPNRDQNLSIEDIDFNKCLTTEGANAQKSKFISTDSNYENYPKINIYNDYLDDQILKNSALSDNSKIINLSTELINQNSSIGKLNNNSNSNLNIHSGNDSGLGAEEIIITDIIYENYIFKSRNNNKLKKYYIVLIGKDLFYFSNSKKKKLRGMHNLSGSYISEDEGVIKVREEFGKNKNEPSTVLYFPFKLYFKKKARIYYSPNEEEAKMWIRHIRSATKFKDVKDYYTFGEELGSGKFGKVKLGLNKQTNKKFAIKIINKANLKGCEMEMVKTEIEIMKFCRHKNIVRLIDNFEDMENIYIVLEYLSGGNLNYFLSRQQTLLTEERIKDIINQMANGVNYLHNFGIIHRDLKPENTMMHDSSDNSIVKIVDFGLSKILGVTEKSNEAYGTLSYAAPEVIMKHEYNNKIDIWSLGVIMYFLICGYLPFNDKDNNFSKIAADITKATIKFNPVIWNKITSNTKDLVLKCLERDVKKRLNIMKFLEHPSFSKKTV